MKQTNELPKWINDRYYQHQQEAVAEEERNEEEPIFDRWVVIACFLFLISMLAVQAWENQSLWNMLLSR